MSEDLKVEGILATQLHYKLMKALENFNAMAAPEGVKWSLVKEKIEKDNNGTQTPNET